MSDTTVILVHGLWMTGNEMVLLKRRLRAAGFRTVQFRYRMVTRPLDHNVGRLAAFIRKHAGPHTSIVGHSLGGVLALHTLKEHSDLPVERVVCLGSPLKDTHAGRRFASYATGKAFLGRTLPEAIFDKPLGEWTGAQEVGVVAGTRSLGLGRLIAMIPKPNDGMVAVRETNLPGITDHLTVPVGHTALVLNKGVAEQCVEFILRGRFRRTSS